MFLEALADYRGRLLVACSGGADSVALAHALMTRPAPEAGQSILLVYVDHGLREESGEEGRKVCELAAAHGAEALVKKVSVPKQASVEAAARDVRYAALHALAEEHAVDWILLGHTASDQVETILMRILRGTGLVGVAGMPKERGQIARPLLGLRRQDTEQYCRDQGLSYFEDTMNRDQSFTRTRIRHHWLPALRKENPKLDEALLGLAGAAQDHREVLDWAADQVMAGALEASGALRVEKSFRELPDSLAARVLVRHAEESGIRGLERRHLLELLRFAQSDDAGSRVLNLPGGRLRRTYDLLEWNPDPAQPAAQPEAVPGHQWRHFQAGDRMRPERLKGRSRKLSDLYTDSKIPKELRKLAWVLQRTADGEIVWAEHLGGAFDCDLLPHLSGSLSSPLGQDPDESAK